MPAAKTARKWHFVQVESPTKLLPVDGETFAALGITPEAALKVYELDIKFDGEDSGKKEMTFMCWPEKVPPDAAVEITFLTAKFTGIEIERV